MDLSSAEVRVLGCLLEKQRTTPDHYPLTLNALRLACNQSTNREPVTRYDDTAIRDALHRLERRGYTRLASGRGSRAPKHRHLLAEALPMDGAEQAIVCVLMLRGPQTPGELKQRTERMHPFASLDGVQETLRGLIERGLVAQLDRRPGQKEERYAQLLGDGATEGEGNGSSFTPVLARETPSGASHYPNSEGVGGSVRGHVPSSTGAHGTASTGDPGSLATATDEDLRARVARLEREVAELRAALVHS